MILDNNEDPDVINDCIYGLCEANPWQALIVPVEVPAFITGNTMRVNVSLTATLLAVPLNKTVLSNFLLLIIWLILDIKLYLIVFKKTKPWQWTTSATPTLLAKVSCTDNKD